MRNPHKALKAIEILTSSDLAFDLEFVCAKKEDGKYFDPNPRNARRMLREAAQLITDIYIIAHAEGNCKGHPEWEDKKYKIIKEFNTFTN